MGVFSTYARRSGHALLDRALSLPAAWTDAWERCCTVGMPADRAWATTPTWRGRCWSARARLASDVRHRHLVVVPGVPGIIPIAQSALSLRGGSCGVRSPPQVGMYG